MRIVLGILAGIVVAVLCVFAVESLGHIVYPPPAGLDPMNLDDAAQIIAGLPAGAFAFVAGAWFVGALAGAWMADAVSRKGYAGWIVALVIVAGGVYSLMTIPHPGWMWAAGILLPLIAAWLAQRLAGRRSGAMS